MNVSNCQIEQQCPQCGAPVILDETDRILSCKFCRTRMYLEAKDYFRYFIPETEDIDKPIYFIPYWRLKGLSFTLNKTKIAYKFFDKNILAFHEGIFPSSLGLRPQTMKLKFVSMDKEAEFIEPARETRQALTRNEEKYNDEPNQSRILIGETASVIYSPVYFANNSAYDAVLRQPLGKGFLEDEIKNVFSAARASKWQVNFIPMLCPHCGADLPGEKDSLITFCPNCDNVWKSKNKNFTKINVIFLRTTREDVVYLPFWRLRAKIDGVQLQTYADLIDVANLPKVSTGAWEKTPFYFWAPAFKVNPSLFLRWCRQLTVTPFSAEAKTDSAKKKIYPVTLPVTEAEESCRVTFASMIGNKRRLPELLAALKYNVQETTLVMHPFSVGPRELVHTELGFSMNRNSLNFGRLF